MTALLKTSKNVRNADKTQTVRMSNLSAFVTKHERTFAFRKQVKPFESLATQLNNELKWLGDASKHNFPYKQVTWE